MADPMSDSPETPGQPPRRRRRRTERNERRKRIALLLLLLALATGAVVLAPGLIDLIQLSRPGRDPIALPARHARTDKPLPMRNWRFDFSMGPILELIEQSLNLEPFDLRRPLRIPFSSGWMPRGNGEILLADPESFSPSFVPGVVTPPGDLPPAFIAGQLPGLPEFTDAGGNVPNGQPEFDPDLADSDDVEEEDDDDDGGTPPNPDPQDDDPDPPVPAPPALPLLVAALALGAALRRRSR
jgi:MYXO-CTERM domain-containing protein